MGKPFPGLRTAIYKVGDLDRAKRWYAEAFGVAPYFDEPSCVGFDVGGYELGLLPDDAVPPAGKTDNVLGYWRRSSRRWRGSSRSGRANTGTPPTSAARSWPRR